MKKFIPLIIFVSLIVFLYSSIDLNNKKLPSPLVDKPFPNIEVEDFYLGEKYFIQDKLKNELSFVNVWASWCPVCRIEHDVFNYIAQTNSVQMIGINYKDEKKDAIKFLDELGDPFNHIIFDKNGKLGLELGVYATPETFIVDKEGIIIFKHIGEITWPLWDNVIYPLIKQQNNKY